MNWKSVTTLLLFSSVSLFAQAAGGLAGISGTVRDVSNATVANAVVVITSASKGQIRSIVSNDAGVFSAPALIPEPGYQVTVKAAGFGVYEVKGIDLQVGQNLDLNVKLQIAQTATQVEVAAVAPLVDDSKSDVSHVVNAQQIQDLPINGRRVDSFVLLTPGVTNDATFGLLSFRGVAGNNSFLLDGNDNTEQFYNENAGRTRIQSQISQDAVQEFEVVSADMSAEYGLAMGGVVNTVTKSGSNGLHGSAFGYLRSTGMDARDPFATFNPSEHRDQMGGTVGGPIVKDKLFYFASVDITRRNFPMVDSYTKAGVLTTTAPYQWIGCGAPATVAQCNAINNLLPRFYGAIPRKNDNDLYFGRLDYHLSERNSLTASFNFLRWLSPNGIQTGLVSTSGSALNGNGDDSVRVRNGNVTWTAVPTNALVNQFRFGWDSDRQADTFDQAELGQGVGYLQVSVAGVTLGPASYLPRVEPNENRAEFADNATWTKGRHTFKFGVDIANTNDNTYYISNAFGSYTYQTATKFALDYSGNTTGAQNWQSYVQTFGNPVVNATIREYGFYAQDQWRATNKLTLTLGARYEYSQAPQPPITNTDWPQTGVIHTGPLDLAPRLGIAYRLNDKTVLRGGFGTFYARFLGSLVDNLWTTNGIYQIADTLSSTNAAQLAAGPVFPNALGSAPTGATVSASTVEFAAPNLKTPYSEQGTIGVERQIGKDMVLTLSGVWSHGVNLYDSQDLNAPAATVSHTYTIDDLNGNAVGSFTTPVYTGARPNTKYGTVYEVTNGESSYYDGLVATFEKRLSRGVQMLVSYTWSHEIDDGQGAGSNALYYNSFNSVYNGNYTFEKGTGLLDQRQRLVYSFVWQPTFTHRTDAFSRYVLNNWQFAGITTIASGRPVGSASVRLTDTPVTGMLSSSVLDGFSGGSSRVPFLPVNGIETPAAYRADLRLTKVLPISENLRVALAVEAFNISNSWSPTSMSTQYYTEKNSILTPSPTGTASTWGIGTADGGFPDGTQARRLQVSARITF
jgi:outer membrane receptor protein involved in Fe transport